jgi:predicted regulator of Ras-like GTPase activity (Roadblock/LC7/MglB family)
MIEAALQAPLAPELPAPVEEPVEEVAPQPAPSAAPKEERLPDRATLNANRAAIRELLDDLAREVSANAVLLTYGEEIALWVGTLPAATVQAVADAALQGWRTSAEVARALGREQGRFEQSISGGDYMLYAVSVAPHALLAIAIQGTTSLGLLRLNARGTAREIAALCCTD